MKQSTKQRIVEYLMDNGPSSAKDMTEFFGFNKTIIHRHLRDLIDTGDIKKTGTVPRVLYFFNDDKSSLDQGQDIDSGLDYKAIKFLDENYMSYDSDGTTLLGHSGFFNRCTQRNLIILDQYKKYYSLLATVNKRRDERGLFDTLSKLKEKTSDIFLDGLYVCDPYQIGHYGKSTLGSLAFYAKQSQNKGLIEQVAELIQRRIKKIIKDLKIDAICFAPISIKRSVQLMDLLQKRLDINLPVLSLEKYFPNGVVIPQKSIKGTAQRIKNSTNTIFVKSGQKHYNRVLLFDDFIASGATLNISAQKLKAKNLANKVIGIAIVGNLDLSYEVINEV